MSYQLTCWTASILDGIWIAALLNKMAGRKLRESGFHYLIFLFPIATATYLYYAWQRYERLLALTVLIVLGVMVWLYAAYISDRNRIKGLVSTGIAILTVITVTGMVLSCFVAAGAETIVGDLIGEHYQIAARFHLLRMIVSAVAFNLIGIVLGKNTKHTLKKGVLLILFVADAIVSAGVLLRIASLPNYYSSSQLLTAILPLILTALCLTALYFHLQKQQKDSYEARLFAEKKRFEENRYNDANAIWENVRKVQHDMKQHLTVISGFLSENKTEECREYLSTILPNVDRMGNLIKSDNRILDYLINSKLCALENTQVVISGTVGDLSDIADADLACLMGNILDNAVEGTANAEEKRIELHFSRQNANRIIICKNTVSKSVLAENRELKSTKPTGNSHGYGTKIVAEIVAKYHGMIDYYEEFDLFCVQIILPVQK